jgi:hypothetical protein
VEGARRLYAVDATPLQEVDLWLQHFRRFWNQRLDAVDTELMRGERERRDAEHARVSPDGRQPTMSREDT